jgi:drug/metabolite transporter (DMT)-like permease
MAIPRRVIIFLCIGLAAASQSGNIIRIGDAHPVAMTTWRLAVASLLLALLAGRDLAQLGKLSKKERCLLGLAGLALSLHFFTWTAAVQLTTVANATVFFSFNPVITATASYFLFDERASKRLFLSIALGIAGVAAIGGGDLSFNREHLAGDGMAILCSLLFTVYFLVGKRLRQRLDTGVYVTSVYGTAAVVGFISLALLGLPAVDYTSRTWLCFILLALIPTMIGHTSVNNALRYIAAGKISAATLSEPLLAGLVAYFAWDEAVTMQTAVGYVLISLSVIVLVSEMGERKAR